MQFNNQVLNQKATPAFFADAFANRPAAGYTGRMFVSTDTYELYRDNGTTYDLIGGPGAGTITGSGTIGTVPLFTAATVIGDSVITQSAGVIAISTLNTSAFTASTVTIGGTLSSFNMDSGASTAALYQTWINGGGMYNIGVASSTGTGLLNVTSITPGAYSVQFLSVGARNLLLGTNNTPGMFMDGTTQAVQFAASVTVPDAAYGSGWNGDLTVPTKNAIWDAGFAAGSFLPLSAGSGQSLTGTLYNTQNAATGVVPSPGLIFQNTTIGANSNAPPVVMLGTFTGGVTKGIRMYGIAGSSTTALRFNIDQTFDGATWLPRFVLNSGSMSWYNAGGFAASFAASPITTGRVLSFPDFDGTIATNPMTAVGDLIQGGTVVGGVSTPARLAAVATGNVLLSGGVGVASAWGQVGLTTHVTGTLPVANGGTGLTALGTGVATALGVNVGSAGAFVVNGDALSGTVTLSSYTTQGIIVNDASGVLSTASTVSAGIAVASTNKLAVTIGGVAYFILMTT